MPDDRPRMLTALALHDALVAAGVIRDGESIRRIVIDAQADHVVVIHVERFGDTRLLDVVRTLDGIEVRESPAGDVFPAWEAELLARKERRAAGHA